MKKRACFVNGFVTWKNEARMEKRRPFSINLGKYVFLSFNSKCCGLSVFFVQEIIREKIEGQYEQEIPYSVEVTWNTWNIELNPVLPLRKLSYSLQRCQI